MMAKGAIVVLAGTDSSEGLGRVVNALVTAREFKEAEDEVVLLFDGAGTRWIAELLDPGHKYHGAFEAVRDVVSGACGYCATAYGVRETVEEAGIPLLSQYADHPSIRGLVSQGYSVVTF
jgi:hypothetical protein